ncbi:MAG: glycosyltransferase family 2 protein [Phycisphaeraceae bacterium]
MPASPAGSTTAGRCLLIVPAFNERESIAKVVRELRAQAPFADVLVIDDGSTDGTPHHVPRTATVVSLPFNLGIGGAMQTGYRYAALHGYDFAVQVDADGQHPADQVPGLLDALHTTGADMVIGSRFIEPGGYQQSFSRMAGIRVLGGLIQLLTGKQITDCTSGFRAVNRRVIQAFAHWYPEDYPEPEVAMLLHRGGFQVCEVPAVMQQRTTGESAFSLFNGLFYVVKVAMCLILDTIRNPWPSEKVHAP